MRILIAGGPKVGKTTLAEKLAVEHGVEAKHTDDVLGLGWSEASAEVARWLDLPGPLLVEGVAVARAVRKWLAAHPEGAPADVVYVGRDPKVGLTSGQLSMAKGCETVWREIAPELARRGVRVEAF